MGIGLAGPSAASEEISGRPGLAGWRRMVPLWDADQSAWFAYERDGRLAYANQATSRLTGRPVEIGSERFVLEPAPGVRRAVERVFHDVRTGVRCGTSIVVPTVAHDALIPLRVTMTLVEDASSSAVVGNASRMFASDVVSERLECTTAATLERIMAEISSVLPDVPVSHGFEFAELSDRQNEVLRLIVAGHNVADIARRLHLSRHTVRNHVQAVLRCAGVHSQAELIAWCRARQLHPSARPRPQG